MYSKECEDEPSYAPPHTAFTLWTAAGIPFITAARIPSKVENEIANLPLTNSSTKLVILQSHQTIEKQPHYHAERWGLILQT